MKNKLPVIVLAAIALIALPFAVQLLDWGSGPIRIVALALLYVLLALGLNIVVGYAGLLDLGYVAFYAVGAYMYGLLASPHLMEQFPWIARHVPQRHPHAHPHGHSAGRIAGRHGRRAAGRAHAQAAWRLPGHRHAGLRRDHPGVHEQPGAADQPDQRAARHQPDRPHQHLRPRAVAALHDRRLPAARRGAVLLPVPGAGDRQRGAVPPP